MQIHETSSELHIGMVMTSMSREGGGITPAVKELCQALYENAGCHPSVFALQDSASHKETKSWGKVPASVYRFRGPRGWGYSPGLLRAVEAAKVDVLHRHGIWNYPSRVVMKVASKQRLPYIVSTHGMLNPQALKVSFARKAVCGFLCERRFLNSAGCIHALSGDESNACRNFGLSNAIAVIPNGVVMPGSVRAGVRPWLLPDDGRKTMLYLGRLHPIKGLPKLIRAWSSVSAGNSHEWRLVIAGWDQLGHRIELETLVSSLGLEQSVFFVGGIFGDEKASAFYHADAFVLPSTSEAQPVALLEAWAYGLPAVLTEACNLSVAREKRLSLVSENSLESLASQLHVMIAMSDSERQEMGRDARKYTEEYHCWKTQCRKMRDVYEWMLGRRARPDCVVRA